MKNNRQRGRPQHLKCLWREKRLRWGARIGGIKGAAYASFCFDGVEKESVQSVPLVKFFHCVSFLKQAHLLHILPSIDTTLFTFLSFHCASIHCYILPGPLLCLSLSFKITPLSSILSLLSLANLRSFDSFKEEEEPYLQVVLHHVLDPQRVDGLLVMYANHIRVCSDVWPSTLLYVAQAPALPRLAFELSSLCCGATALCNPVDRQAFQWGAKEMRNGGGICSCIEERGTVREIKWVV